MKELIHKVDSRSQDPRARTLCYELIQVGMRVTTSWEKTTCSDCQRHRQVQKPFTKQDWANENNS